MVGSIILLIVFLVNSDVAVASEQSVVVFGQLICDKKYLLDAEVEIWERDWCKFQSRAVRYS